MVFVLFVGCLVVKNTVCGEDMEESKLKVIYIAGSGRSGSTLLERILGQHRKIFAAGELRNMWERSFIENQLCSCGEPFHECVVWKKIREKFLEKEGEINPEAVIEALSKSARVRRYVAGNYYDNPYFDYINRVYVHLYSSIIEATSVDFVLDSSKHPVLAHILSLNKNIELYVIHLVRDPRGVVYSWKRKKLRPEIVNRVEFMPEYSTLRTVLSWIITNKIASDLRYRRSVNYLLVRYEDLIESPKQILQKIFDFLKIDDISQEIFINERKIILNRNHTVSGNPMRFQEGEILLSLDEEWKKKLGKFTKKFISIMVFPYLRKYGYRE